MENKEMDYFNILLLDPILYNILDHCDNTSYVNFLVAMHLDIRFTLQNLQDGKTLTYKKRNLLQHNVSRLSKDVTIPNFNKIWEAIFINTIDETFIINHKHLVDIVEVKSQSINFKLTGYPYGKIPYTERNFTELFHQVFPQYKDIKICWGCHLLGMSAGEPFETGKLCQSCTNNQCPRCRFPSLYEPLQMDERGCCQECAGCSQYDD
jgi:hypothetical protein